MALTVGLLQLKTRRMRELGLSSLASLSLSWSWPAVAQMVQQPLQGEGVALRSETAHHSNSTGRQKRLMAKGFTGMGVAQMQLHVGDRHP